jgi:DNA-binding XRE family transcriptional regulator
MDAGLLIKEFAAIIGVTEDTVINWEVRGMRPWRRDIRTKVSQFICKSQFSIFHLRI